MASTAAINMCTENRTNAGIIYEFATDEMWEQWNALVNYFEYQPWIFSLIGSTMVGLSGVLPLLVIPIDAGADLKNGGKIEIP